MIFLATTLWQKLEQWDKWLFIEINSHGTNSFFDVILPFIRNPLYWAPLYLFLFMFVLLNLRTKGVWWLVLFLSTVALTDITGTYVFKHTFQRLRPCSDPDFFYHVRLLLKQCGGYSFISNHAANHFGMAGFFFITLGHRFKNWKWIAILWAAFIAYAQVYVGIHYPFDVLAGALLGIIFGFAIGSFFNKRFGFVIFGNQANA